MSDAATRWWLIRHAPVPEAGKIIYGTLDLAADLSDRRAFAALARELPHGAAWITTPLKRARDTIATLMTLRGVEDAPQVEPELAEQDFGDWEGRSTDEIWPSITPEQWSRAARIAPPNGETFEAVVDRVTAAMARLNREFAGRDIVAVLHAGSVRAALTPLVEGNAEGALGLTVRPLSLSRIDCGPDGATLHFVNRKME